MRPVTTVEREVVPWFAARANERHRARLLSDLDQAHAEETRDDRLFQLQVLRFEAGPVQGPDWTTLRESSPEEIVTLGSVKISSHRLVLWRVRELMGRLTGRRT